MAQRRFAPANSTMPSSYGWKIFVILALGLFLFAICRDASYMQNAGSSSFPSPDSPRGSIRGYDPYGSFVPEGVAIALPSERISDEEDSKVERHIYGGKGDKAHLGGFTAFDPDGVSVSFWKSMVTYLGIKSVLDLGCGRGTSTSWFVTHGLKYVVCAEGSHDAVTQSLLPKIPSDHIPTGTEYEIVEHDFSRGPWWPSRTVVSLGAIILLLLFNILSHVFFYLILSPPPLLSFKDAVWCVEVSTTIISYLHRMSRNITSTMYKHYFSLILQFTEHVGRNYQPNYLTAWRKSALIFMTHSYWGGWHHVEVHEDAWWILRMTAMGFVYSDLLTQKMRGVGGMENELVVANPRNSSETKTFRTGQHVYGSMLVR